MKRLFTHFRSREKENPNPPVCNPPLTEAELAIFYAELCERAEGKSIKDLIDPKNSPEGAEAFLCYCRDHQNENKLIGIARFWLHTGEKTGMIYDISVRSDYRGLGYAPALYDYARRRAKGVPGLVLRGNPARITGNLDRELGVIRMVYAFSLTLGFREITESVYSLLFEGRSGLAWPEKLLFSVVAFAVGSIGIRFFWGVGNIRRFVLRRVFDANPVPRPTLIYHVFMLLLHALVFIFICHLYKGLWIIPVPIDRPEMYFILGCGCFLLLNSFWLRTLTFGRPGEGPERLWIRSNLFFGILLVLTVVVSMRCAVSTECTLLFSTFCILANSVYDLWKTRDVYVLSGTGGGG